MDWQDTDNPDEPSFRLNDFKKWMDSQQPFKARRVSVFNETKLVGQHVEPKISSKRLLSRIVPEDGDIHELARDFKRDGGEVVAIDDQNLIVEVKSGTFAIPRFFVRTQDD